AQGANISMDRAIQVATSKYPGKVLACSLGRDKEGPVFYHVVIIVTEGDKTTTKYVWVSAVDGTIIKTEDERKVSSVSGGTLNARAITLPQPQYPDIARAAKAQGRVTVEVTIDEQGNVIEARAISGHPLLQGASVKAARQAKFARTYMQEIRTNIESKIIDPGPVTVTGRLTYNFVIQ
ncbi:MAG TPA: TonB family protein, partial [Pyrinomonadaceae bacterium]